MACLVTLRSLRLPYLTFSPTDTVPLQRAYVQSGTPVEYQCPAISRSVHRGESKATGVRGPSPAGGRCSAHQLMAALQLPVPEGDPRRDRRAAGTVAGSRGGMWGPMRCAGVLLSGQIDGQKQRRRKGDKWECGCF